MKSIKILRLVILFALSLLPSVSYPQTNSSTFTDPRDGKVYKTITIGTQTWTAENLNYATEDSWCNQCETYGRLYTLDAAVHACPKGWHLPSDSEWQTLINFLGGDSIAGGKMKETDTTHWKNPNTGATNSSGFSALPCGSRSLDGIFLKIGYIGYFWTTTQTNSGDIWAFFLDYRSKYIVHSYVDKKVGLSVRCIRDK